MSRLCRLKTASHGDDGKWAYDEIVTLRKQRDDLLAALEAIEPWIPKTSAKEGGASAFSAHVRAADIVRDAIASVK